MSIVAATIDVLEACQRDADEFARARASPVPAGWPEFPEGIEFTIDKLRERPDQADWWLHLFFDPRGDSSVRAVSWVRPMTASSRSATRSRRNSAGRGYATAAALAWSPRRGSPACTRSSRTRWPSEPVDVGTAQGRLPLRRRGARRGAGHRVALGAPGRLNAGCASAMAGSRSLPSLVPRIPHSVAVSTVIRACNWRIRNDLPIVGRGTVGGRTNKLRAVRRRSSRSWPVSQGFSLCDTGGSYSMEVNHAATDFEETR